MALTLRELLHLAPCRNVSAQEVRKQKCAAAAAVAAADDGATLPPMVTALLVARNEVCQVHWRDWPSSALLLVTLARWPALWEQHEHLLQAFCAELQQMTAFDQQPEHYHYPLQQACCPHPGWSSFGRVLSKTSK